MKNRLVLTASCMLAVFAMRGAAQTPDPALETLARLWASYRITTNITYLTASDWNATVDVYAPVGTTPNPTLIFFHGGGWTGGDKVSFQGGSSLLFLPFLDMGWNVVSVDYRVAKIALAPAAVEDGLCALKWVHRNAKQFNFDTTRLVVAGQSAGGLLALTTGMIPSSAGLDNQCPGDNDPKVAAMISIGGMADATDILIGPNARTFAISWFGSQPNREDVAKRVSPMTYVRPGVAPILMVHGEKDNTAPLPQMVKFHEALDKAAVPNELFTVAGAGHGNFNAADSLKIFTAIRSFLRKHRLTS